VKLLRHDLHTLTGAYALDAIDGRERERFEHHLYRCQSCGQEVRGLQETATRLALAVARVPPPELKVAVLAGAARTRQHPPLTDDRPAAEPRLVRRPRLAMGLAAVATVLVVVLAVALVLQRRQLDTERAQQRAIAAVLAAPGARILTGPASVGGTATVVVAARLHELVFTSARMPVLASTKVYQLWLIGPSGATSAGLLPEASQGRTAPVLASGLVPGDEVGVTVEPAGGTRQPTTKPVVLIKVAS
jgi:anti-sigma-K factor RskA